MPFAIDQEKLDSPNTKILDINNPPLKSIAVHEFPRMVFAHPKDKSREHKTKIVHSADELKAAQKQGWQLKPHIPQVAEPEVDPGEYEIA